jgi:hypothetical protein
MRVNGVVALRADLAIIICLVLGLSLAIAGMEVGLRWLSVRWDAACHRLLHAPTPPRFTGPWRVTIPAQERPCR